MPFHPKTLFIVEYLSHFFQLIKSCFCPYLEALQFSQGFIASCWHSRQLAGQGNCPTCFPLPSLAKLQGKEQGPTLTFPAGKSETSSHTTYFTAHLSWKLRKIPHRHQTLHRGNKLWGHSAGLGSCVHFLLDSGQGREDMEPWHGDREKVRRYSLCVGCRFRC